MQNIVLKEDLLRKIKGVLNDHENNKNDLLSILLETQSIIPHQYIPKEVADFISKELEISLSKIYDVITFYSALSDKPRGKYIIQLCNSTVCKVNKYDRLKENLEDQLGIAVGETTKDGMFTLMYTPCFGACDISPAFRIDENVFGNLTEKKVKDIIQNYRIHNLKDVLSIENSERTGS
jgi:NADH:ubiquinone oxidoreductase subunit E